MGEWYVSALASAGAGSEVDPWTLAEYWVAFNAGVVLDGDRGNIKADGVYTQADLVLTNAAAQDARITTQGYTTTIGDEGRATIRRQAGETGTWFNASVAYNNTFKDIIFDVNNVGDNSGYAIHAHVRAIFERCELTNGKAWSVYATSSGRWVNCCIIDCSAMNAGYLFNCIVDVVDKDKIGIYNIFASYSVIMRASTGASACYLSNCIVYDCTTGISSVAGRLGINNIIEKIDGTAITTSVGIHEYNPNIHDYGTKTGGTGTVYLTGESNLDPQFVDPSNYDFRIRNAALRGLGLSDVGMMDIDYEITPGVDQVAITLPDDGKVISPEAFGWDADPDEGEYDANAVGDVRDGTAFGDEGVETGTLGLPTESETASGVGFGEDDTEFTGNRVQPAVRDVEKDVAFGPSSGLTGTFGAPDEDDTRDGVGYGEDDTEFEGNVELPTEPQVEVGVTFDSNGSKTGTLAANSYDLPLEVDATDDAEISITVEVEA